MTEDISWNFVDYEDNQGCLDLIDKKPLVFVLQLLLASRINVVLLLQIDLFPSTGCNVLLRIVHPGVIGGAMSHGYVIILAIVCLCRATTTKDSRYGVYSICAFSHYSAMLYPIADRSSCNAFFD